MGLYSGVGLWLSGGTEIIAYTVTIGSMDYGGGFVAYGRGTASPGFGSISPADARQIGYSWTVISGARGSASITAGAPFRVISSYISGLVGLTSTPDSGDHYVEVTSYTETPLVSGTTPLTLEWL